MSLKEFVNSNGLQTFVTFIVGFVALFIYILTRKHQKKDAASVIIMEIRELEFNIEELKNNSKDLYDSSPIIIKGEWEKYRHLFVKDLDQDEYKAIDKFYNLANRIEQERKMQKEFIEILIKEKARATGEYAAQMAFANPGIPYEKYREDLEKATANYFKQTPEFNSRYSMELLKSLMDRYYPITNTTAGAKIKNRAKFK